MLPVVSEWGAPAFRGQKQVRLAWTGVSSPGSEGPEAQAHVEWASRPGAPAAPPSSTASGPARALAGGGSQPLPGPVVSPLQADTHFLPPLCLYPQEAPEDGKGHFLPAGPQQAVR